MTCDKGPNEADPLNQRGHERTFADTPEVICGIVADWVLRECERQEQLPSQKIADTVRLKTSVIRDALSSLPGLHGYGQTP